MIRQDDAIPLTTEIPADANFCRGYQCPPDVFDEMCVDLDQIRSHWQPLIQSLQVLGRKGLEHCWQEARRLLRDNGVTYNAHGDPQGQDRPWQLDPIPLVISSEEWAKIELGLVQRAELMKLLLTDLYGPRRVLRKGLLPPELVTSHPNFLRACSSVKIDSEYHLPLYGADLLRAPDGNIWVIADRSQAPPGAGYALENRLVLSRVLPTIFRQAQTHRLGTFFRTLRDTLTNMGGRTDARVVLLTSGPHTETYFEHAYLANYLGYTLVESADLTVREGKVYLKTLDGLQRVDVILRRINDSFCDPLELRPDSMLGIAGLVQSARMGNVAIANPLGSGILENVGLTAFMDKLARYFLAEDLQLKFPATWWCGQTQSRDYVLTNLDKLLIKQIFHNPNSVSIRGRLLSNKQRELLRDRIRAQPYWFVGTEEVPRSTTPVFANGQLEPRQMILRTFLVSSEHNYLVMPGGLTRVSSSVDSPVVSNQSGGLSKDTWVLASEPDEEVAVIHLGQTPLSAEGQGELPSRVAENLFWVGRYAERAEGTIRLLRTVLFHLAVPYNLPSQHSRTCLNSLLRAVTYLTETYPGFVGKGAEQNLEAPEKELLSVFLDKERKGSLSATLQSLLNSVRSTRDRVPPDIWRVINDIDEQLQTLQKESTVQIGDALAELDRLITALAALSGLSLESMTHGQGWRFLMLGRRLERAHHTVNLLRATLTTASPDDAILLEYLLTITDTILTYRRRYRTHLQVNAALELILQSEINPRAVGYQLVRLDEYISALPRDNKPLYRTPEHRLILEALTQIRLADVDLLATTSDDDFRQALEQLLVRLGKLLPNLSVAISSSYFSHIERQPRQLVELNSIELEV
jgi:uncharacterized circularly permuted ATP-grasp superfamily protein/uncharacterized alpha-E superfamily protein